MLRSIKLLFNRRWPQRRICLLRWCLREQIYDSMCSKHIRTTIAAQVFDSGTVLEQIRERKKLRAEQRRMEKLEDGRLHDWDERPY